MSASTPAPEAGPSRIRRPSQPSSTSNNLVDDSASQPRRPASPETTLLPSQIQDEAGRQDDHDESAPRRPSTPHLDLATYPTTTLLRLLASLLQQIASANDQLRPDYEEMDEDGDHYTPGAGADKEKDKESKSSRSRSGSHASSNPNQPHPSPTTALFTQPSSSPSPHPHPPASDFASTAERPLFTASKLSLSHPSSLLSFHARHVPSISIEAYLLRILKYCPTTNEVFLGLLVYFDRMSKLGTSGGLGGEGFQKQTGGRGFAIDSYNVHRLVIAGVTVASKFFSDVFYTNSRYAKVGGLPPHELNQLELQFLLLNDFRLVIPIDEMQRYGNRLLGYWESLEADEENVSGRVESGSGGGAESRMKAPSASSSGNANSTANGAGVAAPSAGDFKAALEMTRSEDTAKEREKTTPTTGNVNGSASDSSNTAQAGSSTQARTAIATAELTDRAVAPPNQKSSSLPLQPQPQQLSQAQAEPAHSSRDADTEMTDSPHQGLHPDTAGGDRGAGDEDQAMTSPQPPSASERALPPQPSFHAQASAQSQATSATSAGTGGGLLTSHPLPARSSTTANTGSTTSALTSGLRDWARNEEVMGVVGGRMTSPMRD